MCPSTKENPSSVWGVSLTTRAVSLIFVETFNAPLNFTRNKSLSVPALWNTSKTEKTYVNFRDDYVVLLNFCIRIKKQLRVQAFEPSYIFFIHVTLRVLSYIPAC